ncbi:YbjN domain-containing protein [Pectinatus sottacetonis]|uniref:YbjN domain-containing protein n=1 Tax=Pectinatus sottacetonis TaxID=1002795 RepID=UPI0018C681A5|nr:YbjN domain-containing protein [Pectinatus sottacetonis]
MPTEEKPEKKQSPKNTSLNEKAEKFQKFLEENNINVFSEENLDDNLKTVVFRSRIETKGQILPMAIIIDTSVFTLIRTQIISGVTAKKQQKLVEFLNQLNMEYKIFKYYLQPDGIIFLDVCLPFVEKTFDSNMIQLMLNILVQHLNDTYETIMSEIWSHSKPTDKQSTIK